MHKDITSLSGCLLSKQTKKQETSVFEDVAKLKALPCWWEVRVV